MPYVYILSEQTEYGGERMTATLNPGNLSKMIDDNWPGHAYPGWRENAKSSLAEILSSRTSDSPAGSFGLHDGYGGLILDIVSLV